MDENEGEHAGSPLLKEGEHAGSPLLKDVMFCRGRLVPALIIRVLQEPRLNKIILYRLSEKCLEAQLS